MWKLIDTNTRRTICHGDWVRTLSGQWMVLRDWSPPPTRDHRGRVVLHDRNGTIHEHEVGTISAECVNMKITDTTRIRVLINGSGCYCRVRDIASGDVLQVMDELRELNEVQKTTGITKRVGDNKIIQILVLGF